MFNNKKICALVKWCIQLYFAGEDACNGLAYVPFSHCRRPRLQFGITKKAALL
jgi:hypothetical protein